MTAQELRDILEETGLPVYRDDTDGRVRMPYLVYLLPKDIPLASDHEVLADWHTVRVELYTARPDTAAEKAVRAALEAHSVFCGAERVPLGDQRMHMTIFEFQIIEVRDT